MGWREKAAGGRGVWPGRPPDLSVPGEEAGPCQAIPCVARRAVQGLPAPLRLLGGSSLFCVSLCLPVSFLRDKLPSRLSAE